jgi:membrane protein implicated in regulation of membrane protease activity
VASNPFRDEVLRKYVLLQIPEAILVVLILAGLHHWEQVSLMTTIGLGLAWLAKDVILYPILRPAYEPGPGHGTEMLIGASGTATDELAPRGMVRVGSELWSAEVASEGSISKGSAIVVEEVDGFTLLVRSRSPEGDEPTADRGGPTG